MNFDSPPSLVIDGYTSVSAWEESCQQELVKATIPHSGCDVLEVGFGLGMASATIRTLRKPRTYVVVESNGTVAAKALQIAASCNMTVFYDKWQSAAALLREQAFDSIVFDPDPDIPAQISWRPADVLSWIRPAVAPLSLLLRPGGRLGFIDFTNLIEREDDFIGVISVYHLEMVCRPVLIGPPPNCTYARHKTATIVTLRLA